MSIRSRLVRQPKNKSISNNKQLFDDTDLLPITFGVILPPNPRGKNSTNSQINQETMDKKQNSKVHTIKILLDSGASVLITPIVYNNVPYKRGRNLQDKKNKWSTMAGTFNTTFVTEVILKFPGLNHSAEIYAKYHLTDKFRSNPR